MYTIVKIETITKFLNYYSIDYLSLNSNIQAIIVVLSNILFLMFWFMVAYILYRIFLKVFDF